MANAKELQARNSPLLVHRVAIAHHLDGKTFYDEARELWGNARRCLDPLVQAIDLTLCGTACRQVRQRDQAGLADPLQLLP